MKMLLAVIVIALVIFYFYTQNVNNKIAQENLIKGQEFLAQNKEKDGVKTTTSGLQYLILEKGTGTVHPAPSNVVKVHYHGTLIDGTVFDSSVDRGEPISFPLNRVIKGWTEGLQLMVVGDKYRFFIPSNLAYGKRATGKIPGNSVLIFDVELLAIEQ
ncbi:FKBP-type peptidyl-prolyl cis-trans isomerase [Parashewanella curva]|uniref:Peptidyl-prolyl cis-trans isomerase n=1 Tax=Parashewanella curva TaxID=2338552 RepID=A0A3L8Q2T1_9GAMM|nr:FKBP-type peptidyl-prolyl cis-trans isomerase [Parashewanella curva]RLV61349.1 FKBP-type peptidyl-prolyl cis-trans isomerase [Parashewanella curva]